MRIDTASDSHRSRLTGRWAAALALTVIAAGLTIATAPPASAFAPCTVNHLTTVATGASAVTYGVIDYSNYNPQDSGSICRLYVPANATEISFMVVGGGGSAFPSFDGAAGGGGAGGVGVHNVTSFPPAAIPADGNAPQVNSFVFELGVGDRDSQTILTYSPNGGGLVTVAAGAGGTGGQGNNNSSSTAAVSGTPGEGGDFPGSGGGGGLDLNQGESGGAAGGQGAYPGGAGFASGHSSNSAATAGGGGGAGGAGSNGTEDATGGAGGTGVSVSSVFPLSADFVTAANLPTTIAEGGDGYGLCQGFRTVSRVDSFGWLRRGCGGLVVA